MKKRLFNTIKKKFKLINNKKKLTLNNQKKLIKLKKKNKKKINSILYCPCFISIN